VSEAGAAPAGPRPSSTRTKARKRALDILFEAELRGTDPLQTLAERSADAAPPVREYTATLVKGVHTHAESIDRRIAGALKAGWTLPRLPRVDRTALRIATYELDYTDLPPAVAVTEAVHLVAELSTDDSPSFVQGVLGGLVGSRQT
jgi:transcription antitermination protein NusB